MCACVLGDDTLYYLSPCCRARCSIISRQYWAALGPLYSHNWSPGASRSRAGQSDRGEHRGGRLCSSRFSTSSISWGRAKGEKTGSLNTKYWQQKKEADGRRRKTWNVAGGAPRSHVRRMVTHRFGVCFDKIKWGQMGIRSTGLKPFYVTMLHPNMRPILIINQVMADMLKCNIHNVL